MSTVFCQPPACDAERERIRELAKYYCVVDPPSSTGPQGDEQPDGQKCLSSDIALTALAQLGVLRFACSRSFVSIIDGANQHIIAEATASVSLRDINKHRPDDEIYLGAQTLDLSWGVCPHTIKLFTDRSQSYAVETENITANSTRYVIRDFTKDDRFKDRPYVVEWPHMRFYAEVPLRSPAGCVLGSYCIVDDKPRSEFGDIEIESLQEVADAIAEHLEIVRISHCHRRTEKLVKSLTSFVKDHADFDPTKTYKPTAAPSSTSLPGALADSDSNDQHVRDSRLNFTNIDLGPSGDMSKPDPCSPSEGTGELSSLFSKVASSENTEISSPLKSVDRDITAVSPQEQDRSNGVPVDNTAADENSTSYAEVDNIVVSGSIASIFARASALLRESMDLEGVVFLDASRSNAGVVLSDDTGTWEPLPSTVNPEFFVDPFPSPADVPGVGSLSKASEKPCSLLGYALRTTSESNSESIYQFNLTEKTLNMLMASFPQGQTFNLNDFAEDSQQSNTDSPTPEPDPMKEICQQLSLLLPDANCVLFSPLWDWNKSRWLAGTLVWTRDNFRGMGADELHYFKAFGDSIISEVARVDWATIQKSKSDFMSSVSHELRSPLHGILASAELLSTTPLSPPQHHLVKMVETCGLTLLDTLNHLLDFSKINNLTALEEPRQNSPDGVITSLTSVFDLGVLVEEVVNVQYAGQKLPKTAVHLGDEPPSVITEEEDSHTPGNELTVMVRVDDPNAWKIQSVPGAWRRIVMNLLGNSLKWTKDGFVEVSLSKVRRQSNPSYVFALLSVTDTGCGIAPDFLRHNLFSPFAQENALSEGLGLGLSIVRQLVSSLSGHVNVRSELEVGTQVDIYIPVQILEAPSLFPLNPSLGSRLAIPYVPVRACMVGFNEYPGLKETPTGILQAEAKRMIAIRSCLSNILARQSNWIVASAESLDDAQGDIAIIEEGKLSQAIASGELSLENPGRMGFRLFMVLNGKSPILPNTLPSNVIRVSQPFGCGKFNSAIAELQKRLQDLPPKDPNGTDVSNVESPTQPLIKSGLEIIQPPSELAQSNVPLEIALELPLRPAPPTRRNSSKHHILIVDDNDINLKILATLARKIGCSYDTASDGLMAFNQYKDSRRTYDLILMDISMPVMDGLVSTSKIRQHEKEQGLPRSLIMAVTGVASTDMQQRARAAGVDEYLVKPVSLSALKKVIEGL